MMSQDITKTRRAALKTGSIALFGSGLATKVGAVKSSNEYVGIVYDPQTKEFRGEASARITERYRNLVGTLDLGGQVVPVDQSANYVKADENAQATLSEYSFRKGGRFKRNKKPLQVYATAVEGGNISGVTDYGVNEPKKGFVLQKKKAGQTKSEVIDDLMALLRRKQ